MRVHPVGLSAALALSLIPSPALAQSDFLKENVTKIIRKVGVHANMTVREPLDHDVTKGTRFGGSIGLSPGQSNGWRYPVGFSIFSENLHGPAGEKFATFKSRAILAGIGYGWHLGKLGLGASVQGGWAFNHGTLLSTTSHAFDSPEGPSSIHINNSPILRPQLKAEYFITRKFTLRSAVDYSLLRPAINVTTPSGPQEDVWHTSNFHANFGVGYYPFRK